MLAGLPLLAGLLTVFIGVVGKAVSSNEKRRALYWRITWMGLLIVLVAIGILSLFSSGT